MKDVRLTHDHHADNLDDAGRPSAGTVVGFALRWPGQDRGALWITGEGRDSIVDAFASPDVRDLLHWLAV